MIARPIRGSAILTPSATTAADATTPSETKPSTRRVMTVGDEGRTVQSVSGPKPHACREFVAEEPDHAGNRERAEVVEAVRVNQALDRFEGRDRCRHEDRQHHCVSGPLLAAFASGEERDAQRDRRERVAAVVDQVGEERH